LNDSCDFILLTTDQPDLPAEGEYYGITRVTRNDTRGLGKSLFDNAGSHGSAGRLQAVIHPAVGNALSGGPSLHEIMHRWGTCSALCR
jgi:hypothetical protein